MSNFREIVLAAKAENDQKTAEKEAAAAAKRAELQARVEAGITALQREVIPALRAAVIEISAANEMHGVIEEQYEVLSYAGSRDPAVKFSCEPTAGEQRFHRRWSLPIFFSSHDGKMIKVTEGDENQRYAGERGGRLVGQAQSGQAQKVIEDAVASVCKTYYERNR